MKHSVTKAILAALAVGFTGATAAYGQVSCGAVITGKAVMTTDLACLFNSPAFTIDGGDVDMNGHRVGCLPGNDGVSFINSGGKLKNGFVEDCDRGVILAGTGKHAVTNVLVRGGQRGFFSISAKNKLVNNTVLDGSGDAFTAASFFQPMAHQLIGNVAANNGGFAFKLTGDGNKLSGNLSSNNGDDGFFVDGDDNKLSRNTAYNNGGTGLLVSGADNSLTLNSAIANSGWGISPDGSNSKVKGNLALDNVGSGIGSSGDGHAFSGNMSAFNTQDGYSMFGSDNVLTRSVAIGNGDDGLEAALTFARFTVKGNRLIANGAFGIAMRGSESLITGNFAVDNTTDDATDESPTCATNTWKKNIFHSTADVCIE